jgi:hypothetical protein
MSADWRSRGLGHHQVPATLRQRTCEPHAPRSLPRVVGDQVPATFDGGTRALQAVGGLPLSRIAADITARHGPCPITALSHHALFRMRGEIG